MMEVSHLRPSAHPGAVLEPLESVTRRVGLLPLSERLVELRQWLSDDLGELERAIQSTNDLAVGASSDAEMGDLAARAARYLLGRPGKRIRPLCVLLGARLGGRGLDRGVRDLAIACELVHNATLLHDDVIDEGAERRGAPTARVVFGNSASVLAGDRLLVHALQLTESVGNRRLLSQLLETISDMVGAEAIQLEMRGRLVIDREVYLRVVHGKTAGLFRWALMAGGAAGGLEGDALATLGSCGNALGIAFQLMDDVLDVAGDPATTGKDVLADLREGKLTWPMIVACEREPSLLHAIQAALDDSVTMGPAAVAPILARVARTGAVDATREFAHAQASLAREALGGLPDTIARRALDAVIESAVSRQS